MVAEVTAEKLKSRVSGGVIAAGDEGYDEARKVLNGMIDRRPRVIVQARGDDEVIAAVDVARESGLELAVRGGAHSVPGFGTTDDGIVIDLSPMSTVTVDPERRTASAGEAARPGAPSTRRQGAHGLATTGGIISTTGVGGLTLGGGIGYLARGHGLFRWTISSRREVVTADGQLGHRERDRERGPLLGAPGRRRQLRRRHRVRVPAHPVAEIYGGPLFFELEHAGDVLRFYREFIQDAPEEFGGFPAWQIAPPLPFIPEDRHGDLPRVHGACWTGPLDQGEKHPQGSPRRRSRRRRAGGPMPYPALNSAFDGLYPPGLQHYWKANFVTELTDEAIAAHLEHGPSVPPVNSTMHIYPINGACHRVAADETAFAYRDADVRDGHRRGMWPDPADNEANDQVGSGLLRGDCAALGGGRVHQLHGRGRPGANPARTTRATTTAWSTSSGSTTPTTSST